MMTETENQTEVNPWTTRRIVWSAVGVISVAALGLHFTTPADERTDGAALSACLSTQRTILSARLGGLRLDHGLQAMQSLRTATGSSNWAIREAGRAESLGGLVRACSDLGLVWVK